MKKSAFALPSRRNKGKGGYPINDPAHARNALARASQQEHKGNLSANEAAEIRKKVHKRYPSIGEKGHKKVHGRKRMR